MLPRLSIFLLLLTPLAAQQRAPVQTAPERHAAQAFEAARTAGPLALHAFIERMPKGADLHMHLSGAVYAETFLKDAAEDHLCIDPAKLAFLHPAAGACAAPLVPAANAFTDQHLYDALIDSFSMRSFVPSDGTSGHDQFFATFGRYGGTDPRHHGEWLDEIATRAAAQNEQYLEVMDTPTFTLARQLGRQFGWPVPLTPVTTAATSVQPDAAALGATPAQLAALRTRLLDAGLRKEVATDRAEYAESLTRRRELEQCDSAAARPACAVQIRFLYQVLRQNAPEQVFAQTLLAFEVADAEAATGSPAVVGLNFVQPEDAYLAMSEYHRQMLMLDYLHSVYPRVRISLHAGELAPGMVPPAGLRFHIREAIDLGHAERIGHGVDVMYETDPQLLLKELAERHVQIEVNLTSNDVILGVKGNQHSLPAYLAAHVPVAFSTDDEGVSRIDLTHEYTRAAVDFGLNYLALKRSARTSVEHAFLPGADLWQQPDEFTRVVAPCAAQPLGADQPNPACTEFLRGSPRAAQEWELEHRFRSFESTL